MSVMALSPLSPQPPPPALTADAPDLGQGGAPLTRPAKRRMTAPADDVAHRPDERRPPPVQACADWQVLLHLPQTEAWLRASGARVTRLTSSVAQDGDNRHVDAHLLQLKDICEDISDHVEQIHALLETELSLKLLSYSVNVIVDIRTVQLLWHQLRVSVLVLKERLLRGLQDPNGNFTGRTDILQAFSRDPDPDPDRQQTRRLDALTEVDDCGRLTIRCSRDYFSLDCGITAYELSDYSPGEEPETGGNQDSPPEPRDIPTADSQEGVSPKPATPEDSLNRSRPDSGDGLAATNRNEAAKRSLSADGRNVAPSLPKRLALISDHRAEDNRGVSELQIQARASHSSPDGLVDPPVEDFLMEDPLAEGPVTEDPLAVDPLVEDLLMEDPLTEDPLAEGHLTGPPSRSKFWLELDCLCPENPSEDIGKVANGGNICEGPVTANGSPFRRNRAEPRAHGDGDSDFSAADRVPSSDLDASGEDSDPRPAPGKMLSWPGKQKAHKRRRACSEAGPDRERWYGSEDFLALPAQIHQGETLAVNLESLARALRPSGEDLCPDALQDVDDWDLTELTQDSWDSAGSGDDVPSPALVPIGPRPLGRLSPASSGDTARWSDESIECGRLSEPLSEEEPAVPPLDRCGSATLLRQLLEDVGQDRDPDVWSKMERLVRQLDGLIGWLQGALESTGDWTPPEPHLDALKLYLDTHLAFKVNVDGREALKESIVEDATALLAIMPAQQSGLRDILRMVSGQWEQLRLQIRRQHAWMLRALRVIRARLLLPAGQWRRPDEGPPPDRPQEEPPSSLQDARRDALREMAAKLGDLRDTSPAGRPQDFERAPDGRWDLPMEADDAAGDSRRTTASDRRPQDAAGADVPERLRASVEELKAWLRRTELLIYHSCLRRPHRDARRQLASFKTLCSDVRARRGDVSRLLKLCRRLLRQNQPGPEAERDGEDLQLLSINLERRWEAVLMQTLHWRNRLKRELGEHMAAGDFPPSEAPPPDDWWEWDETDMTPAGAPRPDLTHDLPCSAPARPPDGDPGDPPAPAASSEAPAYQEYGLHALERKRRALRKSLSCDSTFSSAESLPDLLGGLTERRRGGGGGGGSGRSPGSESGIVSDAGDGDAMPCRGRGGDEGAEPIPQAAEEGGRPSSPKGVGAGRPDRDDGADPSAWQFPLDGVAGATPPSPASSLESLLSPGRQLFSSTEHLHRSASLGSGGPALCRGAALSPPEPREGPGDPGGALSRRTLDLLKRLEDIPSPPASEMTRSVSDTTLRDGSPLRPRALAERSASSLAELSGAEDSSVGSEDPAGPPSRGRHPPGRASAAAAAADGVSLSMVVNVSCASACTDDEDDGDLLSSSTLTEEDDEVEEETGVREDDEAKEPDVPALDPAKKEPRARVPRPRRTEDGLWDELPCGGDPERGRLLKSSARGRREDGEEEENRRNAARSSAGQLADDLENGNAEPGGLRGNDADADELLREESVVFAAPVLAHKGLEDSFHFSAAEDDADPLPSRAPAAAASSLVGQLKGELPCRSAAAPPSGDRKAITIQERFKFSSLVTEESRSKVRDRHSGLPGQKWKGSHAALCRRRPPPSPASPASPASPQAKEAVRDFVMEILDLTAEARRSKEREPPSGIRRCDAQRGPAPFRHIRAKVAQHSHQPLHLRSGDFYAYLALSSHDSDCGEVTQCAEDKSAAPAPYLLPTPAPGPSPAHTAAPRSESADPAGASPAPSLSPDVPDEETLFPACAEEVYLGPPLCYSLPPARHAFSKAARLPDPEEVPSLASAVCQPPCGEARRSPAPAAAVPPVAMTSQAEGSRGEEKTPPGALRAGPAHSRAASPARDEAEVGEVEGRRPVREPPRGSVDGQAGRGGGRRLDGCAASGGREEARGLEPPSYLNPRARVASIASSPAQCLADSKTLPSNIGAVMTEISGGGGAANPSKETRGGGGGGGGGGAGGAARINPQMNCGTIKEADRAAADRAAGGEARGAKRPEARPGAGPRPREAKRSAPARKKQATAVDANDKAARGRSHVSVRPIRTGPAGAAAIRVHL